MNEHAMLDEATQMENSISCNIRIFIEHSSNIRTKMLDEMLDAFAPAFNLTLFKIFANLQLNNHFDRTLYYNKYSKKFNYFVGLLNKNVTFFTKD